MASRTPLSARLALPFLLLVAGCQASDTSPAAPIAAAAPHYRLAWSTMPTRGFVGRPLAPSMVVRVLDDRGAVATGASFTVSLALEAATRGGATLGGSVSATTINGEARFADLSVTAAGKGFLVRASATGADDAVSTPLDIDPEPVVVDSTRARLMGDSAERANTGVYRFALASPGAKVADSGAVIGGVEQGGFLRRVTSVRRTGATVAYSTVAASLDEVIQNDSLVLRASPWGGVTSPNAQLVRPSFSVQPAAGGVTCSEPQTPGSAWECTMQDVQLLGTASAGVRIASMHLKLSPQIVLRAHWGIFSLSDAELGVQGDVDADAEFEASLQGSAARSGSIPVAQVRLVGSYIVGVFPVVVEFSMPVVVNWSVSASGALALRAGWSSSAMAMAGLQYASGEGLSPLTDGRFTFTSHWDAPSGGASLGLHAGVEVRPRMTLDGVVGGEVWAEPFAEASLSADASHGTVTSACRSAIVLGARADLTVLGKTLGSKEYTTTVADQTWPACAHTWSLGPSVASVQVALNSTAIAVGQSTQATATVRDATGNVIKGESVSWASSDPSVARIASDGLLTAVSAGGTVVRATVAGITGTALLTVTATSAPPPGPAPRIASITPVSPISGPTDQVLVVHGSDFQRNLSVVATLPSGQEVSLTGAQIGSYSATSFDLHITLGAAGSWAIRVVNPDGRSSNRYAFTVAPPQTPPSSNPPRITSLSPSAPTASPADQPVHVAGSGFLAGLTVLATTPNGQAVRLGGAQVSSVSATGFDLLIKLGAPGAWTLRVDLPDGTQSNVVGFTVVPPQQAAPAPRILAVQPASPTASGVDQTLHIVGTDFVPGLTVLASFPGGGSARLSGAQIRSVSATGFDLLITLGGAGVWQLRVDNPDGQSSNTLSLTVQSAAAQPPQVTGFNPSSPIATRGNQPIQVNGSGFQPGLTVSVGFTGGGSATLSGAQIQNVSASSFTMLIDFNGNAGSYTIRVRNPDGQTSSPITLVARSAQAPAPQIGGASPSSPQATRGNQPIQVTGASFQPGLTVTIGFPGGGSATLSGAQIQNVTAGAFTMLVDFNGNSGTYSVQVRNPDGQLSNTITLAVQPGAASAPRIGGFNPSSPQASRGNQPVQVFGNGFLPGLAVTVGFPGGGSATLSGTQIQGVSSSSFTMLIDFNGNAGTYSIRVDNPDGQSSIPASLVVAPVAAASPTLSVSPASGTQKTTFTTSGSGFTPGGMVNRFVAQPGQAFQQISALTASGSGTISWPYTGSCTQLVGTVQIYAVDATSGKQSPTITEQVSKDSSCP